MVWKKMLVEEFQDGCLVDGHLWCLNEWFKQFWVSILPWRLPSIFCSKENMGLKLLFEEFQEGCLVHGLFWYLNGKILAILSLKRALRFEVVVWRISRWLFSAWSFLISEWDDFSYSESPCCLTHSIKFLLVTLYGLEDVVRRLSRCLFSSDIWIEWYYLIWVSMLHDASP